MKVAPIVALPFPTTKLALDLKTLLPQPSCRPPSNPSPAIQPNQTHRLPLFIRLYQSHSSKDTPGAKPQPRQFPRRQPKPRTSLRPVSVKLKPFNSKLEAARGILQKQFSSYRSRKAEDSGVPRRTTSCWNLEEVMDSVKFSQSLHSKKFLRKGADLSSRITRGVICKRQASQGSLSTARKRLPGSSLTLPLGVSRLASTEQLRGLLRIFKGERGSKQPGESVAVQQEHQSRRTLVRLSGWQDQTFE